MIKPDESMVPWQHFAIKGGIILRWSTACHRAANLDGLVQVDMTLLKRVRVRAASEDGQGWRHRGQAWGVSLPGTMRSSSRFGTLFTSLSPYPPKIFKLKQTAHCLSITSEHQQLFNWAGRQASASPITSFKTQRLLDQKKSPASSFQSIFPRKKRLKHWAASAKKTPGRQFGDGRYPGRRVTHQFLGVLWDPGRFSPTVAETVQHCSMKRVWLGAARKVLRGPRERSRGPPGGHRRSSGASGMRRGAGVDEEN